MRLRVHQYLIVCNHCGRANLVLQTGEIRTPPGWYSIQAEDGTPETIDVCPPCHEKLKPKDEDETETA